MLVWPWKRSLQLLWETPTPYVSPFFIACLLVTKRTFLAIGILHSLTRISCFCVLFGWPMSQPPSPQDSFHFLANDQIITRDMSLIISYDQAPSLAHQAPNPHHIRNSNMLLHRKVLFYIIYESIYQLLY